MTNGRGMAGLMATAALLALGGCGGQAASTADQLDNAAAQSDPAAAAVLSNEADAVREGDTTANVADPASPAQSALENAGAAAR